MGLRSRIADLRGRGVYSEFADEYRAIFIHVPKAAGTSVTQALFNRPARHVPWQDYFEANPRKFNRYFKFAFVRNPWDRLVSTYFFLKAGGLNAMDRDWAAANLGPYPDFDAFVRGWLTRENAATWVHFKPQRSWICDDEGVCRMDFVGRFETLDRDFQVVARRLGCARPLEKGNRSEHRPYHDYYTPETRDRVADVYAADIDLFGYRFDTGHAA